MGDILVAHCPCLYESEHLYVGCGFSSPPCFVPALCRKCRTFITVDPTRARCPTCRRKPLVFNEYGSVESFGQTPPVECPFCGQITAIFENCGVWD